MQNILRMVFVLSVVSLFAGAALVSVYNYAEPLISDNQKEEIKSAIFSVFPEGVEYKTEKIEKDVVYKVFSREGKFAGYAVIAEGNGYQGKIKMILGILPDLTTLKGIEILESQETPGLGQSITDISFKSQFYLLKLLPKVAFVKNKKPERPNEIQAITGATISSSSVVNIINSKVKELREKLKE